MDAAVPVTADAAPVVDEDAFRVFYDRTARQAWAYLFRATGDAALADARADGCFAHHTCRRGDSVDDQSTHAR